MSQRPLRVLTISDLFPDPVRPVLGVFIAHQVRHLRALCEQVVVVPWRVFPHLRTVCRVTSPRQFVSELQRFRDELSRIPECSELDGSDVYYLRYTSLPRQLAQGTWGLFAYAFVHEGLRTLHAQRRFDLVHAHYASPAGLIALLAQRWMRVPIVLSIHGSDVTHTVKQDALSAGIIRWVLRNVDAVLVNSTWTAERVRELGVAMDKISIVHLGAEPPAACCASAEHAAPLPLRLLTVAYLEQRKGHAVVLRALSKLRALGYDFRYRSVGDGPCRAELVALTDQLGLSDRVSFQGTKPQSEVWPEYVDCDIFVLPSYDEAFGLAYIEALSVGKPVVGCEGEGGPEELKALGDCIELVAAQNVDRLADALRRLMDDPVRRRELGGAGRRIVTEHFNWSRTAVQTYAVYERVLAKATGRP